MKRILVVLLMLVALVGFVGCSAHINRVMASWQGHNFNDLISSWGPPDQVFDCLWKPLEEGEAEEREVRIN